jgi:class 3 adenylate cyclase
VGLFRKSEEAAQRNFVSLTFLDSELEKVYLESYFHKILPQVKVALLLAIALYSLFAFLDVWIVPESKNQITFIRFAIVIPSLLLVFILTYLSHFSKYWPWLMSLVGLEMGVGITAMVVDSQELGSTLYPTGILLVVMWVYVFSGLRFIQATITCLLIMLSYSTVALTINVIPFPVYLNHSFFLMASIVIGAFAGYSLENYSRSDFINNRLIQSERLKSEKLLLNVLPESIADELKRSTDTIAESFESITILFADIVGFTKFSSSTSPKELVDLLNQIFSMFDEIVDRYGAEKIKTIGDAYMVAGGLPQRSDNHAEAIACLALDMRETLDQFNINAKQDFNIRIGIHTGPVVAGVIGIRKFSYDIWGDSVNTASRMESHGISGQIQVTNATYAILKDTFIFEKRGEIEVKGKGKMKTYFLQGRKPDKQRIS